MFFSSPQSDTKTTALTKLCKQTNRPPILLLLCLHFSPPRVPSDKAARSNSLARLWCNRLGARSLGWPWMTSGAPASRVAGQWRHLEPKASGALTKRAACISPLSSSPFQLHPLNGCQASDAKGKTLLTKQNTLGSYRAFVCSV